MPRTATKTPLITSAIEQRLAEASAGQPLLVTAREAAGLLRVGESTWHRLVAAGKAPRPVKVGGATRWRRADLLEWLDAGCPDVPAR
jgi:excisionase family DNA binding protein